MKKFIAKYRIFIILIILILFAGFKFAPSFFNKKAAKNIKPETFTAELNNYKETLTLSGKVNALEKATLRFQTSGRLSWVGVAEGDKVKKFQALASLDNRDVRKALEKKLNSYMSERWDFEQGRDDYENTIIDDEIKRILEKNQFDLNNSVLDVELAHLSVEYATLYTPIDGVVTKIDIPFVGTNVTPTTSEFEIINPDSLYLSVTADQNETTKISEGMAVNIILDAYPEASVTGKVKDVSFTPKEGETGTVYEVRVILDKQTLPGNLRIEMTADAEFIISEKSGIISVPIRSIITESGEKYIFVNENGKKVKRRVETGTEFDDETEITSGLSVGEEVYD